MRKMMLVIVLLLAAACQSATPTPTATTPPTPIPATATQAVAPTVAATQTVAPTAAATPEVAATPQIALTVVPQPPTVGDATLTIVVTRANQPVANAQVDVRGNMNMAGMAPVLGSAKTDAQGTISIPFKWSMGGDWIVTVTVTLADNSQVSQDFNLTVNP